MKSAVQLDYASLSERLLALDNSIISVTITDRLGELLYMEYSPSAEALKPDKELMDKGGSFITMILALIAQGEASYGGCDYVVVVYGKIKVAIFQDKKRGIIVALGAAPEHLARDICVKAKQLLEHL
jgi:hypothetical protein